MSLMGPPLGFPRGTAKIADLAAKAGNLGRFLVGSNEMWHGGLHLFAPDDETPVVAAADGVLVAYRITRKWTCDKVGKDTISYSQNFALIRHEHALSSSSRYVWYSLYMHLKPLEEYTTAQRDHAPPIFTQPILRVRKAADFGRGLPLFDPEAHAGKRVLAILPEGTEFETLGDPEKTGEWAGYSLCEFEKHRGHAAVSAKTCVVVGKRGGRREFRVIAGTHPNPLGVPLRRTAHPGSKVIGSLPPGSVIALAGKGRAALREPREGETLETRGGGWFDLRPTQVDVERRMSPRYDAVVTDRIPVRQGEIIGYPGAYDRQYRMLHFEVFSGEPILGGGHEPQWANWLVLRDCSAYEKQGRWSTQALPQTWTGERVACVHPTEWHKETTSGWWEPFRQFLRSSYEHWVGHAERLQWWADVPSDAELPAPTRVVHFNPVGFTATANGWARALTLEDKKRIFLAVKEAESAGEKNPFAAANRDFEYTGAIPTAYKGKIHVGLSWGIIQFTQDGGALGRVLERMHRQHPALFAETFGPSWAELLALTKPAGVHAEGAYAPHRFSGLARWYAEKCPSTPKDEGRGPRVRKLAYVEGAPPEDLWEGRWLAAFKAAAEHEVFQRAQLAIAYEDYFDPALRLAWEWRLRSERGIAVALDRVIQQGPGGARSLFAKASAELGEIPGTRACGDEGRFLRTVAEVFDSDPRQKKDVQRRITNLLQSPTLQAEGYDPDSYLAVLSKA